MIKLKDLLNEIQVTPKLRPIPEGWEEIDREQDLDDIEMYGGEVLKVYEAPMDGWDKEHEDSIKIIKNTDGTFKYNTNLAYSGDTDSENFDSYNEVYKAAVKEMKSIKDDWDNEEY